MSPLFPVREASLLFHHCDLLVDHLSGKPVDGDVNPVALLALDYEPRQISSSSCGWRIPPALGNHINHQIPRSCLNCLTKGANDGLALRLRYRSSETGLSSI